MRGRSAAVWVAALTLVGAGPTSSAAPSGGAGRLMQWSDLLSRPKPAQKPEVIRYGPAPSQFVELWRPAGKGPHPVVAMIHGGCWTASVADLHIMDWAAADLAARGIAVWNIEYRRLGEPGAGYPGTYRDVAGALFTLKREAPRLGLKLDSGLVVIGHSAGGHLALWAAGAARLAETGPLKLPGFPEVRAVVDLAGIPDLQRDVDTGCGPEPVAKMAGSPPNFAATSPAHRLPLGAELFVIHGAQEVTVPVKVGERFAAKAEAAGDHVRVLTLPGAHVEEIAPGSMAWEQTIAPLVVSLTSGAKP